MISIIENNKPNITKIKFKCDGKIHEKLDQYEMIRDHMNTFNNTCLFIGKQGSGKTNLMMNFATKIFKKCFHHIYLFMPSTSRNSLENNKLDDLPDDQKFEELNEENIEYVYNCLKANSENGECSLIIYDDVQKELKNNNVLKSLKNIIANQRHLKVVNFILLQNYISLDKSLRNICNNIFLFKLNKTQMQTIFEECIEDNKDKYLDLIKLVYQKPHDFMFINLNSQRIYNSDFNEIIINSE